MWHSSNCRYFLSFFVFCNFLSTQAFQLSGRTYYAARSVSRNAARDLVGYCQFLNRTNCGPEGSILVTPGYQQSFRSFRIAEYYFNTDEIRVSGSQVTDRGDNDLLADYFGLSPAFDSRVGMAPSIRSAYADFDMYGCYHNFFARLHLPISWTRWDYRLSECINNDGLDDPFPAGYMADNAIDATTGSFEQAIRGHQSFGDAHVGLTDGLIKGSCTKFALADARFEVGYHILRDDCYYVGLSLIGAAPTGNRSQGINLFEPIVGNGHHWELGLGFVGRALAWEADGKHSLSFYGSIQATHLFSSCQRRCFDLCQNGFGSRYLLLKEFDQQHMFNGNLVSANTITTQPCTVSSNAQFDIVAMLGFLSQGIELDFGYNAWIRTEEHVRITGEFAREKYGIKGIQNVVTSSGSPDNSTQSTALVYGDILTAEDQQKLADPDSPVFLDPSDLNALSGSATSAFTSKFFGNVGYAWHHECSTHPYISLGGEVEFEGLAPLHDRPSNNNTVAQWGIWAKGGVLFN